MRLREYSSKTVGDLNINLIITKQDGHQGEGKAIV